VKSKNEEYNNALHFENEKLRSELDDQSQRVCAIEGESRYLQDLLNNEKKAHSDSLKLLHEKLDPHGSITGIDDPVEILALVDQIIDIYIEKLQEGDH
jgi:hypothetical protein